MTLHNIPEITITDKPCPKCGREGATGKDGDGSCLKCVAERLERSMSVKLGPKTIEGIFNQIKELLETHFVNLNQAYIKHGEEKFSISFKVIVEPRGKTSNHTDTQISYRPEPDMKDSTDGVYDEAQMGLFDK